MSPPAEWVDWRTFIENPERLRDELFEMQSARVADGTKAPDGSPKRIEALAWFLNEHVHYAEALRATYASGARRRGYSFNLTPQQFRFLISIDCSYCGSPPSNERKAKVVSFDWTFRYSGIDRVDNARGYEVDNVVPCCSPCNRAKGTMTRAQFETWLARVRSVAA